MYSRWNKLLFTQVDNSALVLFRILYGVILAAEAFGSIALGAVRRLFIDPEITFPFILVDFLEPMPPAMMYTLYGLMGTAGLMIMLGAKYRYAMLFYAIAWTYVYLLQKSSYNNHCYLIMLLNWVMVFLPASRSVSLDARFNPQWRKEFMSRWIYVFIIAFIWVVYAYASIAKFYPDWLDGSFPKYLMSTRGRDYEILQHEWAHTAILYFGLLFDLLIVPFLLWRRTRWLAVGASVFFHLFNSIVFKIGVFPYLALAFLLFFFTTATLQKRFLRRKKYYREIDVVRVPKNQLFIKFSTITFLVVMLLLPLRHWVIPGDVLWTEEGHRLSWRMMLRSRRGYAKFYVKNLPDGAKTKVKLRDHLSPKQLRSVQSKPDFMWQFAQHLREQAQEDGQDIAVYVDARVGINGRPLNPYTNPEVDLSREEWQHFKHHDWILPAPWDLETDSSQN